MEQEIKDEGQLAALAASLGADTVAGITPSEVALVDAANRPNAALIKATKALIRAGQDPLGAAFTALRTPEVRRPLGATYTPDEITLSMVEWAANRGTPARVIDPGTGSGRFIVAAGRRWTRAQLIAVEVDPLAALLARGHLAAAGMARRSTVVLDDFRALAPEPIDGRTLYIGNPPYVRHHQIAPDWKDWLARTAGERGHSASKLAGLHVHFFLATATMASRGDYGAYITAAEWLDVNYGSLVRDLLLNGLGGQAVHLIEPKAMPFADAATTGAISTFDVGTSAKSLRLRRVAKVADLANLDGGRPVKQERLVEAPRWTPLFRTAKQLPAGMIELGELCRVHRGTVTGANSVWVTSGRSAHLHETVLTPSVTKARELFAAGDRMASAEQLRRVVDLPADLDELPDDAREGVDEFLRWAKSQGAHQGYIARHRKAWYSVGMRPAAPILATYMARRPPAFVRNIADARHINIAHGLYPRQEIPAAALDRLADALRETVTLAGGRTYAGGLTKFEPREMERLPVPTLDTLLSDEPRPSAPMV